VIKHWRCLWCKCGPFFEAFVERTVGKCDQTLALSWVLMWAFFEALLSKVLSVDLIKHRCLLWWTLTNIDIVLSANVGLCQSVCQKCCWGTWSNIDIVLSANVGLFPKHLSKVLLVDVIKYWCCLWWTLMNRGIFLSANVGLCWSCRKNCRLTWSNIDVFFGGRWQILTLFWVLMWAFVKASVKSVVGDVIKYWQILGTISNFCKAKWKAVFCSMPIDSC